MSSFEEIIAAGVMGGEAEQNLAIGRATVKMAIMHHRTYFCACGNGLDQYSAAVYEISSARGTLIQVVCGECHGHQDFLSLLKTVTPHGYTITVNTWANGEVKHAIT